MKKLLYSTGLLVLAATVPALVSAADTLVPGKIVSVKALKLAKFVAKPPTGMSFVLPPMSDFPNTAGATLRIFDTVIFPGSGAGDVTYNLLANGWTALGNPAGSKGFKYKGKDASPVDDVCKIVLLKANVIKAVCKGTSLTVPFTTPFQGTVGIILSAGAGSRYCLEFGGTEKKNDNKLTKRKDAPAPPQCPLVQATPTATNTRTATNTPTITATGTATGTVTITPTVTETRTPSTTPTNTPLPPCPLTAGRYTITNGSGGTLQVASIGPFPFPSGGTVVQDVSAASQPACVHTTTVPFPGGFSAPQFCIPVLNFNVIVAQTGCGVGQIDSNGGSDYTVHEVGDTSAPSAPCALPDPDCNPSTPPDDNNLRVDITVGNGIADTCGGGGTANAITAIPVQTTTWTNPPLTCPDPDGQYDPGTDTLITQFPQILDFTTDSNFAEWMDIDPDGCSISGSGPASGFTATGACINLGAMTITTAAAGTVGSKAAPLHDLTFKTTLPSTISGPTGGSSSCGSPPAINFAGTATRCLSAP